MSEVIPSPNDHLVYAKNLKVHIQKVLISRIPCLVSLKNTIYNMVFGPVFMSLCFLAHLIYVLRSISVYKKMDEFCKDNRALYFKINSSLSTVDPDGNGLYWCHNQDRKLRKHFGPGVKFAYGLKFKINSNRTLHCAIQIIVGDVASINLIMVLIIQIVKECRSSRFCMQMQEA